MLGLDDLAEVGLHQSHAMLERALQIGDAPQELNLVRSDLAIPIGAQLDPVPADVLEFLDFFDQRVKLVSNRLCL